MVVKKKNNLDTGFTFKSICVFLAIAILNTAVFPTISMALTSGPVQPEFAKTSRTSTAGMVDMFSGNFSYTMPIFSLPDPNGEGYSMGLTYNADASPSDEASWVGYRWALNPGAIVRNKRGFEDDANGLKVKHWHKRKSSHTISGNLSLGVEFFSGKNHSLWQQFGPSASIGIVWNNYSGFHKTTGAGLEYGDGLFSVDYKQSLGEGSWSVDVNPFALMSKFIRKRQKFKQYLKDRWVSLEKIDCYDKYTLEKRKKKHKMYQTYEVLKTYALDFSVSDYPTASVNSFSISAGFSAGFTGMPIPIANVGGNGSINGNYSYTNFVESKESDYFGSMYSGNASDKEALMDYFVERNINYKIKDRYLGIPMSNVDVFNVIGGGESGAFRLRQKSVGTFRPQFIRNYVVPLNYSYKYNFGGDFGKKTDKLEKAVKKVFQSAGVGTVVNQTKKWETMGEEQFNANSSNEGLFFRFNGDAGGEHTLNNDEIERASLDRKASMIGFKKYDADENSISQKFNYSAGKQLRSGRSKHISHHTFKELNSKINNKSVYARSKREEVYDFVDRTDPKLENSIGEYSVTNSQGSEYVYGLPVYARNEASMSYDIGDLDIDNDIVKNRIAYKDISVYDDIKTIMGHENKNAYASQYLLTEILNENYIDLTNDGPSDDDFGGWTKFNYDRLYGSDYKNSSTSTNWFKWRLPYKGLLASFGEMSSKDDNMGTASWGEKEIYYLDEVETKTHKAVFYKSDRKDGLSAAGAVTAAKDNSAIGDKKLKKLDKISVFKKGATSNDDELLYEVHFEYDYSLFRGVSNNEDGIDPNNPANGGGKLTLKRVWKEYKGVKNAKITPTTFVYNYMKSLQYDKDLQTGNYAEIVKHGDAFIDPNEPDPQFGKYENPIYNEMAIDAWGNYQSKGESKFNDFKTTVEQNPIKEFDPAACQLKQIISPTGGIIQIQYEQSDYSYVHDRLAHIMVPLKSMKGDDNEKFVLDLEAVGITDNSAGGDIDQVLNEIRRLYVVDNNETRTKIFFKFLYSLMGKDPNIRPEDCRSEFIKGYVDLSKAEKINGEIVLSVHTERAGSDKYTLPKSICRDFVKKKRGGIIQNGSCYGITGQERSIEYVNGPDKIGDKLGSLVESLVNYGKTPSFFALSSCKEINTKFSAFRIPIANKKKGGGIRVKRLLTYDDGIESGDASLYGTEYIYEETDKFGRTISTGVATNEPSSIEEENILVRYLGPNKNRKAIGGEEKLRYEGPFGKSILPGASIGYSKVITKNIYKGKTHNGIQVDEFYTYKDYPFNLNIDDLSTNLSGEAIKKDWMIFPLGVVNYKVQKKWLSQGYRFKLNDFHGKPKSSKSFAGDPFLTNKSRLVSSKTYEYFEPGEKVPVFTKNNTIEYRYIGKEVDLIKEAVDTRSHAWDVLLPLDANAAFMGLILPSISWFPTFNYKKTQLNKHVTTKIVHEPTMLKKVTTYSEGVTAYAENLAFSENTGAPLIVKSYDSYNDLEIMTQKHNGAYHSYTIPASYEYPELGQKAANERHIFNNGDNGWSMTYEPNNSFNPIAHIGLDHPTETCPSLKIYPGDVLKVFKPSDPSKFQVLQVGNALGSAEDPFTLSQSELLDKNTLDYIAALPLYIVNGYNGGHNFDKGDPISIEVLKSGRRNRLNESVGSVTTYGNDDHSEINDPSIKNKFDDSYDYSYRYKEKGDEPLFGICPNDNSPYVFNNVVSASAIGLSEKWDYPFTYSNNQVDGINPYEDALVGRWRMRDSWTYRSPVQPATGVDASGQMHTYENAGVFLNNNNVPAFEEFNWRNPTNYSHWVNTEKLTNYDVNGRPLRSQNILGIPSIAKYGYNNNVVYLTGTNTEYAQACFYSFELQTGNEYEGEMAISYPFGLVDATEAHAGESCLAVSNAIAKQDLTKVFTVNQNVVDDGMKIRLWAKFNSKQSPQIIQGLNVEGQLSGSTVKSSSQLKHIGRTGEWSLYEASLNGFVLNDQIKIVLVKTANYSVYNNDVLKLDDIKVQPTKSAVSCTVFDKNDYKILASFGDQHFGMFYKYNEQGQLTHKVVETLEGTRTIGETQYNVPLQSR